MATTPVEIHRFFCEHETLDDGKKTPGMPQCVHCGFVPYGYRAGPMTEWVTRMVDNVGGVRAHPSWDNVPKG